jgi:lysozyme
MNLRNLSQIFGGGTRSVSDITALGIDVSDHNGTFDWQAWEGHIEFAAIKATEGNANYIDYKDPTFARNWAEAKALGLYRFAYHYFHPAADPASQAKYFYDYVAAQGIEPHDGFMIDFEENDQMTPVNVSFSGYVFASELTRLLPGHKILIYTYPAFAQAGNCAKLGQWPLWISEFGVPKPVVPPPWSAWEFWQHVGSPLGQDTFNGAISQLEEYMGSGTVTTEPGSGLPVFVPGSRVLQYVPGKPMIKGTDVQFLQRFLLPVTEPESWADGIYGPLTAERVTWYEQMRGMKSIEHPYGIAGPEVWRNVLHG